MGKEDTKDIKDFFDYKTKDFKKINIDNKDREYYSLILSDDDINEIKKNHQYRVVKVTSNKFVIMLNESKREINNKDVKDIYNKINEKDVENVKNIQKKLYRIKHNIKETKKILKKININF